jgi:hypothetical protein
MTLRLLRAATPRLATFVKMSSGTRQQQTSSSDPDFSAFIGKFERYSTEKYEEYLDALDVNIVKRKAMTASNPVLENKKSGDTWTACLSTALKSWEASFQVINFFFLPS